jgi:assimilatory nitrate reductase catalytic subunit
MQCKGLPLILNTGRTVEQFHTRTKTGTIGILDALAPEAWVDLSGNFTNILPPLSLFTFH